MAKISPWLLCVVFFSGPLDLAGAQDTSAKQHQAPGQHVAMVEQLQSLKQEVEQLRATVAAQSRELAQQKRTIESYSKKSETSNAPWLTMAGAIFTAGIAGIVAIINSNKQAAQQRLLKAIELIMESSSGYQADIRKQNLAVFLDEATKEHLKNIKMTFSGPEHTDLHVALAEAMSAKATNPAEVQAIWKEVMKDKKIYNNVQYLQNEQAKPAEPSAVADPPSKPGQAAEPGVR